MYGLGSIKVVEEAVELRTRSLLAWGCKKNGACFFVEVDQWGCGWLVQVVDASSDCMH